MTTRVLTRRQDFILCDNGKKPCRSRDFLHLPTFAKLDNTFVFVEG